MFSEELRKQARGAKSVQELRTMANERGIEMNAESAEKYYAALHPHSGVVADDELANVTGGCGGGGSSKPSPSFAVGDSVYDYKEGNDDCHEPTQEGPYVITEIRWNENGGEWEYKIKEGSFGWRVAARLRRVKG